MKQVSPNTKSTIDKVKEIIGKNRQSELFYKAFLRPIQIALKTSTTQKDQSKTGCMPFGLKQVIKTSIDDNKFTLDNFQPIDSVIGGIDKKSQTKYHIDQIRERNCDNLISLLKPVNNQRGIKIAICICMYSEDKSMLKKTLSGISQNIEVFHKNGYQYNQIGVFVIMDGIQVVDSSVQQFFQELQKDNNIYLSDDVQATDLRVLIDNQGQKQEQQVDNLNHLIFSDQQFEDRKKRRFSQRKKQYKLKKQMIKQIEKLETNKTLTYDTLDPITQSFFLQKAKEQYRKQYANQDADTDLLLRLYAQNIRTSLPIIRQALNETKKYCIEYLSTRDHLALFNTFRVTIETIDQNHTNSFNQQDQQHQQQKSRIKMNLFFITKYKNRGKLSSHNWFFNGFCQQLKPTYAILLDVGLTPQRQALFKMCRHMQKNKDVGGVCGYMGLRIQKVDDGEQIEQQSIDCITSLVMKFVDIQRAQQFQYHFAHLIDKPFESSFNFIHVLPGAFSAYRMQALRPEGGQDSKLLKQYFKSIQEGASPINYKSYKFSALQTIMKVILPQSIYYASCFYGKPPQDSYQKLLYDQNVYLAQDRTLCMGIHQNGFNLTYLPDANAWVDPIKTLYGLLGQRKRWINGSFFAFQKVKQTLSNQNQSNFCLRLQILYLTIMNMLAFIAPALFMYTVHIAMYTFQQNVIFNILSQLNLITRDSQFSQVKISQLLVYIVDLIYVIIFLGLVFFSMHLNNRFNKFKTFFYGVSTTYGVFSLAVFGVLIYDIISGFASGKNTFLLENPWFVQKIVGGEVMINSLRYIMIGIMGLYVIPVIVFMLYGRLQYIIDIIFSTFSFVFFSPTYLNILNIYALCRIDDISWGTKGINTDSSGKNKQMSEEWKKIKLIHVSKFVLYNFVAAFILLLVGDDYAIRFWITFSMMVIIGSTLGLKVIIGAIYLIIYRCKAISFQSNSTSTVKKADFMQKYFDRVKDSMYKIIENSISKVKQENKSLQPDKPLQKLMFQSKIHKKFNYGKDGKLGDPQKFKNNKAKQGFSRVYEKNMKESKNRQRTGLLQDIKQINQAPSRKKIDIYEPHPKQQYSQDAININIQTQQFSGDNLSQKQKNHNHIIMQNNLKPSSKTTSKKKKQTIL